MAKPKPLPVETIKFYWDHWPEFIEDMVFQVHLEERKHMKLEPETVKILNTIAHEEYTSIHSGRGVTKTASLAMAAICFLYTRTNVKVAATGPKFDQLKITLWAEIQKWLSMSCLTDELKWSSERIWRVDNPATAFGQVITAKDKENISGIHAEHVMWIGDEYANVEEDIHNTIVGGLNDPEIKFVIAGNPTKTSGAFFRSFTIEKDDWAVLHFNSEDCARCNKKWLKKMKRFPRDSDMYRVNVLGLPPQGNPKAIMSLSECEAARSRELLTLEPYLEMGVDPAREGNDLTAISIRHGMKLLEVRVFAKTKAPEIVTNTVNMLREYRAKTGVKSRVKIKIDKADYGAADYLAQNKNDNIEVVVCNFGGKGNDEYTNEASTMWFNMRDQIHLAELPNDDELIEELSTREWSPAGGDRQMVEPKPKYKERLGRSPDRADSVILCYALGPKKVFGDSTEDLAVRDFEIDWANDHMLEMGYEGVKMAEILHYVALVINDDLSIEGLAAIYQVYGNRLWLYHEFHAEIPVPQQLALQVNAITHKGLYGDEREARTIGNEKMFKKADDSRPLADVMHRHGLHITEPIHFDEYGAIALGVQFFAKNRIIFHETLIHARLEIGLWSVKKGKPEGEKGYAKALLLILSEVRRHIKPEVVAHKMQDYHPVYENIEKKKALETDWMKR